jgi:hypothetical protein
MQKKSYNPIGRTKIMTTLIINIKNSKTTETVLARLKDVEGIEIEEKTSK